MESILDHLTAAFGAFTKEQELPSNADAVELLFRDDLTTYQREWLEKFSALWNWTQDVADLT